MATTKSKKALCHLVCRGNSSEISEDVLKQELERNVEDLKKGILSHEKPTEKSLAAFTSSKKVANKLTSFIIELSKFIDVEESATKTILQTYLAGDFRGTKESLKKLVNEERCQKPLLTDIWHFHQAEKLYVLRVLKEILTQVCSAKNPIFQDIFKKLDDNGKFKESLINQLKSLIEAPLPSKDKYFTQDLVDYWAHFNLRQQCELLQILLLYFHQQSRAENAENVIELIKIFSSHKFGTRKLTEKVDKKLVDSIGHLESTIIIYLLDLPGLTETVEDVQDLDRHNIWKDTKLVQELDKNIGSNLGNLKPHGPPMLAWMLSHYIVNNQQMSKYQNLGQTAFNLKVVDYLLSGIKSDVINANKVISAITHGVVYSLLSILVSAFDPSRMNIFELVLELVCKDVISSVIFKEGLDQPSGIAGYVGNVLNESPVNSNNNVRMLASLASGSKNSTDSVLEFLNNTEIFAEPVEEVPSQCIEMKGEVFINLVSRHKGVLVLSNGVQGTLSSDGRFYLWKMTYDGFKILFNTVENLLSQVVQGAKNISNETLDTVISILDLMEQLSSKCKLGKNGVIIKNLCLALIEKFICVPNPPIQLLAGCLRCLKTVLDDHAWKCLTESGLFPHLNSHKDLNPGIIGTLLAQQECVIGSYPMTSAWLALLLERYHSSVLFVVEEILPSYQNWRFADPIDKEIFGQNVLKVCFMYHDKITESLMKPLPNQTLINIASIGDRIIQTCYEAQSTSETGLGVEMAKLVIQSLELLNKLLITIDNPNAGQLGKVIGSSNEPHFLLIVAHYIYHLQTPELPLSSVNFLSTVSTLFPMSLLACLGNDAEALRDILIHRLESQTEDESFKVAILKFFTCSVKSQPGLIQLLLGVENQEDGCLKSVMTLLKNEEKNKAHEETIEFIYNLWSHSCALAVKYLKKQPDFWKLLTQPLFSKKLNTKVNGFILRILSTEVFAFKSTIDKDLVGILEKLFDEKANHIQNWCDLMVMNSSSSTLDESVLSVNDKSDDINTFLLASWKTLLIVLSKDQPISLSPGVCHKINSSLIKAVRAQLSSVNDMNMRMTISLSETSLILMQRWLTKCSGDSIVDFMKKICLMMDEFATAYDAIHPRARIAILGITSTSLKISTFKIENERDVLVPWLYPTCTIVEKALQGHEDPKEAVLALGLLRGLLQRLSDIKDWIDVIHQKSTVMSILSYTHHCLRSCTNPEVIQANFGLLLTLSKSGQGCHGLLATDLAQMIWLPLSCINKKLDKDWILVFTLALQLALNLIQVGQQHALDHIITVVALLQDQLLAFLVGPKNGDLDRTKLDLTAAAASLIGHLMAFYKQWQMVHSVSLNQFYMAMSSLLHTCACLLIRPSLLNMVVSQKKPEKQPSMEEMQRVRRLSSTEQDHDSSSFQCPDTVHVQNRLLDTISSCLRMLIALSPDLVALVTDDLVDTDAFEQLLQIGFSTPAFEQDESQGISYGTIISVSNFCIRTMTHGDRSPSPARSSSSADQNLLTMDRKRLLMVLEQGLTLMLSQALLCLANDKGITPREKQLLRRELGAELGSVNETMRRYFYRSLTKSPQTVCSSPTMSSTSTSSRLNKTDEQFMKFVSNIVQKVFK